MSVHTLRNPDYRTGFDDHILGRVDGETVGIPRIMDLLEARGMKGVFFLDIFMEHLIGREAVERTVSLIADRGHDIQLHLHPSPHLLCAEDASLRELSPGCWGNDPDLFRRALDLSMGLFEKRVGRFPVAYRAGSYRIKESHFPILEAAGIRIDMSIYPLKNCELPPHRALLTQPTMIGELLVLPVNWLVNAGRRSSTARQMTAARPIDALIPQLASAHRRQHGDMAAFFGTLIHSYSFLDRRTIADQAEKSRWLAWFDAVNPPRLTYTIDRLRREDQVLYIHEGIHRDRITIVERLLDTVAAAPEMCLVTCRDVVDGHWDALANTARGMNTVPLWHHGARCADITYAARFDLSAFEDVDTMSAAKDFA